MKFLPGAKVSKRGMIPDLRHRRRAEQCSDYTWSLGKQLPTFRRSPQTRLGDPGKSLHLVPQGALQELHWWFSG